MHARTHAHARVRATKYVRDDCWRDRRRRDWHVSSHEFATLRDARLTIRPCASSGPPRRADQRAAVSHDGVSLPRWKNRTQHGLSSKLQNGGRHMPWRAVHSGPPGDAPCAQPRAPPTWGRAGAGADADAARHFRISPKFHEYIGVSPKREAVVYEKKREKSVSGREFRVNLRTFRNRTKGARGRSLVFCIFTLSL